MVSGSISFPSRGAFHLSLTVLVHYRSLGYLALDRGRPSFPPGSSCPAVLRILRVVLSSFGYGAVTPYGRPFQARSPKRKFCNYLGAAAAPHSVLQHHLCNAGRLSRIGWFGLLPVRSPLLRELYLFLGVLRCFSSPACLSHIVSLSPSRERGCPIRRSTDRLESSSSWLIAAYPRPSSALVAKASTIRPYSLVFPP